jgi:hypothetical protein
MVLGLVLYWVTQMVPQTVRKIRQMMEQMTRRLMVLKTRQSKALVTAYAMAFRIQPLRADQMVRLMVKSWVQQLRRVELEQVELELEWLGMVLELHMKEVGTPVGRLVWVDCKMPVDKTFRQYDKLGLHSLGLDIWGWDVLVLNMLALDSLEENSNLYVGDRDPRVEPLCIQPTFGCCLCCFH